MTPEVWISVWLRKWLTKEVNYEAVAVAIDVGGWVRLELDGDICIWGVELKLRLRSPILTQYFSCEVISIVKRHQVIPSNVQPEIWDTQIHVCIYFSAQPALEFGGT